MQSNKNVSQKDRELLPDIVIGIAILLVIWGHSIQYFHGIDYDYWYDPIFELIYGFHMPLFALVNRYLMSKTYRKRTVSQQLLRKSKQFLIPYCVWGFLYSFGGEIVGLIKSETRFVEIAYYI